MHNLSPVAHKYAHLTNVTHIDLCWKNNRIVLLSKTMGIHIYDSTNDLLM